MAWWVSELARDGRSLAGGWPGTLSQARARFLSHAIAVLGDEHGLDGPTVEVLTRRTYDVARESWRARAARDPDET
jgi:hypothetical protein